LIPVLLFLLLLNHTYGQSSQIRNRNRAVKSVPFFEETTIWEHKEEGAWPYHVYGLVQSKKGTLLAFAEGRVEMHDNSPHHLVVKRSTDGGRRWSKNIYTEKSDGSFWDANGKPGKMEAWTNTGPVMDADTGRVFFFYALNEGSRHQNETRVFYRYSDDDGLTWRPRIEITQLFADNPHGWTFHMPGPGHGIQLQNQRGIHASRNGRLVLAVWHRRAVTANPRLYGISLLVSDDHGKTWRHTGDTGIGHGMNEARIVELEDGRILMNARGGRAMRDGKEIETQKHRVYAWSKDAGETFGGHVVRKEFVYSKNGCDSAIQRYPKYGKNILLFSRPANPEVRAQMTMSLSMDEGQTWSQHKLIHDGSSFYSDIVVLPNGTIGLLYGKGKDGRHEQLPHHVAFARFNIECLQQRDNTNR
jgi:sialidase-1